MSDFGKVFDGLFGGSSTKTAASEADLHDTDWWRMHQGIEKAQNDAIARLFDMDGRDADREAKALAFFEQMLGDLGSKVAGEIGAMRSADDASFMNIAKQAKEARTKAYLATYVAHGEDLAEAVWRDKYGTEDTPQIPHDLEM